MPFGYSWGDLGNAALAGLDGPRRAVWNLGPALVGRSGQGPQNGAELFSRLGMNGPTSGAIGAGLGAGLDLVANPMNLAGMGFGRVAPAAGATRSAIPEAGTLTRRLERMVAPVAEANAAGRPIAQARIDNWMQGVGHPGAPFAPGAGGPLANAGALPRPSGSMSSTVLGGGAPAAGRRLGSAAPGYVDPAGFGYDAAATRSLQLNSPNFNPANPAFGLGTGQFTQDASQAARMGLGEYNPLTTSQFIQGAEATPAATTSLMDRLRRMAPSAPTSY